MHLCEFAFVTCLEEFRSIFPFRIIVADVMRSEAIGDGVVDGYSRLPLLLRWTVFQL